MNFAEIHTSDATLSEVMSKRAFRELFTISNWRLYSSVQHEEVDWFVDRYLRLHAMVPTILRGTTKTHRLVYSPRPLQVFRWNHDGLLGEGVLFANGAVATLSKPGIQIKLLFVDDTTATAHHYPAKFARIDGPTQLVFE